MRLTVRSLFFFCIATLLCVGTAFGQHEISGTVVDSTTGNTLPGVNIVVAGTSVGTATDADGTFELEAPSPTGTLAFSFVGYETQRVDINGRSEIDIALAPSTLAGEELVVVGYGTQERRDLTGSVAVADVEETKKTGHTSIAGALKGQVAGVDVQTSGAPGESPAIRIRGIGTLGATDPLYIIDGIPVDNITDFDIGTVESIQVMKDAAASAIYGSRAANGVVIVETGQGQDGGFDVTYNASVSTENVHQRMDVLEREGFQEFNNLIRENAGQPPAPANDPNSPVYVDDINTDWQEAALDRGVSTEHSLSVSGGNETSQYRLSGGVESRQGHMEGPKPFYERFNVRVNSTHNLGRLTLGENISLTRSENRPQTSLWETPLFAEVMKTPPTIPVRDASRVGGFGGADTGEEEVIALNVVGANHLLERGQNVNRVLANGWGELDIIEDLSYKLNLGYDSRAFHERFFLPQYDLGFFYQEEDGQLDETKNEQIHATIENTLTYTPTFDAHDVTVLAGYSEERNWFEQTFARGTGYSPPYFKVIDAAASNQSQGFQSKSFLRSFFGRVQYDYDDRYLLTATVRRDGSSRFEPKNRWGNFPSASVGWRLSEESFFEVDWVTDLKLRGSWGQLGRQQTGDFATVPFINTNVTYAWGDRPAPGAIQDALANRDLRWETQVSRTVGLDASLFDGRFETIVEYFQNDSEDVLVGIPIPGSLGAAGAPDANAASIRNQGFDVSLSYNDAVGEVDYEVTTNVSTWNNEVISLGQGEPIFGAASKTEVGSEVGEIFGYVTDGIFQSQEEVDNHATQEPGTAPGDIRFEDLNGDGVIDSDDRTFLGSPTPDFTYGVTTNVQYRNWDLSMFFQGNYGNKIYNNDRTYVENMRDYNNSSVRVAENHWSPDNQHNDVRFPRPVFNDPNENIRASDRWVEDGSYLKLKNLSLGYAIPGSLVGQIGMDRLRVYVGGQNLFTLTSFTGLDPELGTNSGDGGINNIGNDGLFSRGYSDAAWPHPRRFEVGIQAGF